MTFDKILSDLGFDEGTDNNMILLPTSSQV